MNDTVADIDECAKGTHKCTLVQVCKNTKSSHKCEKKTCPKGQKLNTANGNCDKPDPDVVNCQKVACTFSESELIHMGLLSASLKNTIYDIVVGIVGL